VDSVNVINNNTQASWVVANPDPSPKFAKFFLSRQISQLSLSSHVRSKPLCWRNVTQSDHQKLWLPTALPDCSLTAFAYHTWSGMGTTVSRVETEWEFIKLGNDDPRSGASWGGWFFHILVPRLFEFTATLPELKYRDIH